MRGASGPPASRCSYGSSDGHRPRQKWLQGLATRVLTDLSGSFFTVVVEIKVGSLADWESCIADLFAQPGSADWFARMMPLVESGRREFYTIKG